MTPALQWLLVALGVSLWMMFLYIVQRRTKNAGYVDAAWALGIGVSVLFFCVFGDAPWQRRLMVAGICGSWSLRLTWHLWRRLRHERTEDGRYASLRTAWGNSFETKIFWFFQVQAAAVLIFAFAPWMSAQATRSFMDGWDILGISVACIGLGGLALADAQLDQFRRVDSNRGKTCQDGLWQYSRHPNYFFEWIHWWGYAAMSFGAAAWWLTPLTPLVLLYFLLFKTGIPATEAQALASRGEDYRKYQQTTSAFVPWFRKSLTAARS